MKSERRHELQTNVLANQAGQAIEKTKPFANLVLLGIAAVVVLALIFGFWQSQAQRRIATAWSEYYFAAASGDADQLAPVYEDYASTPAAGWARQAEADSQLSRGLDTFYLDRQQADDLFKSARSGYEAILDETNDSLLRSRATIGLAQVLESQGEVEKAIAEYKKLLTMEGVTQVMATEYQRRIEWLQGQDSQDFYAWYKSFNPAPAAPLNLPTDLGTVPAVPDINFPKLPESPVTPPADPNSGSAIVSPSGTGETTPPPASVPEIKTPEAPAGEAPSVPASDAGSSGEAEKTSGDAGNAGSNGQ